MSLSLHADSHLKTSCTASMSSVQFQQASGPQLGSYRQYAMWNYSCIEAESHLEKLSAGWYLWPRLWWWSMVLDKDKNLNHTHAVQYVSTVCRLIAIWLGAVQRLLPAGNYSCEPRPQAQHPAGLWNQIFIVHKASAKYEESALLNKTHSPSGERQRDTQR